MAVDVIKRLKPGRRKRKGKRYRGRAGESGAEGMPVEIIKTEPGKQIKPPIVVTATPAVGGKRGEGFAGSVSRVIDGATRTGLFHTMNLEAQGAALGGAI